MIGSCFTYGLYIYIYFFSYEWGSLCYELQAIGSKGSFGSAVDCWLWNVDPSIWNDLPLGLRSFLPAKFYTYLSSLFFSHGRTRSASVEVLEVVLYKFSESMSELFAINSCSFLLEF